MFWSLGGNTLAFVAVSLAREQQPIERLQSTLFVDVFRTPATAVSGFVQRSATVQQLSVLAQRYLGIIHEESARLTRLLDSMLDLSLLERGEAPLALSRVDPEAALQAALHTCQSLALAAGVQVQAAPRIAGVAVRADPDRLAQVFINLLSNAIKYNTAAEPWIRVASRLDGERYEVRVQDNGPGIRPEERERVFSKFMRGWSHVQTGHKGAGLGLTISRQIMLRLGGSLTLEWHPGPGACFCVTLPLAPDDHGA
jgi:signal transduction histidine kinase